MIKSMTGYGTATLETPDFVVWVEIKSINSRSLDLKVKFPAGVTIQQQDIQSILEKGIVRGKADVTIHVKHLKALHLKQTVNKDLATLYLNDLRQFYKENQISEDSLPQVLFSLPGIFSEPADADCINQKEQDTIMQVVEDAIVLYDKSRLDEGKKLEVEILNFLNEIEKLNEIIHSSKEDRIYSISIRLQTKIEEIFKGDYDKSRFEQELLYYLEKLDVSEELDRIKSHIKYFREAVQEEESGRKLGFITQELGREINTLGAKANDYSMQKNVVIMKNELEKIKQQLANIL